MSFTHMNAEGRARMVDVTGKAASARVAVARGTLHMSRETLLAIKAGTVSKGDVLAVAQVAGVMAAKKTGEWIPMCHPLPIAGVDLHFRLNERLSQVEIEARVSVSGPTGVEMEAMTAVSAAALTIYDMAKALDKGMTLGPIHLLSKEGGKSGPYHHFRAQVSHLVGDARWIELKAESQIQLLAEGAEADPDRLAVWLALPDLNALDPGACLEAGPVRLEVLYAREHGWVAEVNDGGPLKPGDWLEKAR